MMKSIVSLLLILAVALLLSGPSQAGYADGMNQYAAYHVLRGGVDPTGLSNYQWHHVFPQDIFGPGKRFDLDKQLSIDIHSSPNGWLIPSKDHEHLHRGRGGGRWNSDWSSWLDDMEEKGIVDSKGSVKDKKQFERELKAQKNRMIHNEWDRYKKGMFPDHDYGDWSGKTPDEKNNWFRRKLAGNGKKIMMNTTAAVGASAFASSVFGFTASVAGAAGTDACLGWYKQTFNTLKDKMTGKEVKCSWITRSPLYKRCKSEYELAAGGLPAGVGFMGAGAGFETFASKVREACESTKTNCLKDVQDVWD